MSERDFLSRRREALSIQDGITSHEQLTSNAKIQILLNDVNKIIKPEIDNHAYGTPYGMLLKEFVDEKKDEGMDIDEIYKLLVKNVQFHDALVRELRNLGHHEIFYTPRPPIE
jgi:hypothetical protein